MATAFREIIDFFDKIGIYDVVLPFLLVFTIVFAILEKTKVLGVEEIDGKKYTKKNINAMVAFIIAFLVVASTKLVQVINEALANIVLLLLLSVGFLMLVGSFYSDKEFSLEQSAGWAKFFITIMFLGISLIFINALGWLEPAWNYVVANWNQTVVSAFILLALVIGVVFFVTRGNDVANEKKEGS